MMKLTDREWKAFYIVDVFDTIQRGKRLKTADHLVGNIPYISSSALNNGVDNFVSNDKDVRKFSDCLSLANSGSVGSCFYEPFEFVASDHITHLKSKAFNKYHYLFLATMIGRLSQKYNFNREINDKRISREIILLPINDKGNPDYAFMEEFIKEREVVKRKQYLDYCKEQLKIFGGYNLIPLADKQWKSFFIGDIFEYFVPGKSKGLNHLAEDIDCGISYVGATNRNNGILSFVQADKKLIQKGNAIGFIKNGNGSAGYSIYKAEKFVATSDVIFGYAEWLNKYVGLFITSCSDMSQEKYSHGYKWTKERLLKSKLMLPVNEQENPDYEYMEKYSKNLLREKIQNYISYIAN